ncbi:hypothetical protein CHS0354_017176 [Potamilus streckersoni]|uniref:Uncharacterized protein n=1 Tax=Potamilus streckersoni TaxID=2493646 RepID=A0AAE0T3B6_9BIVA|nr:hypothetical protein CHS0354_017176 [Potamilus streckersoni]
MILTDNDDDYNDPNSNVADSNDDDYSDPDPNVADSVHDDYNDSDCKDADSDVSNDIVLVGLIHCIEDRSKEDIGKK